MPRIEIDELVDMEDPETWVRFERFLPSLHGWYEWTAKPRKNTRSLQANRWYWACVVEPFRAFLNEQNIQRITKDRAHLILKLHIIPIDVIDPLTGELLETVPGDTHDMSVAEFYDYCERCMAWLAQKFDIVCQTPEQYGVKREVA